MCKQVISEYRAHEEGGSTVLLLSKYFSAISSNQSATPEHTCTTMERERLKRLLNPRGQEYELQIQTILVFVLKIGNLFIAGFPSVLLAHKFNAVLGKVLKTSFESSTTINLLAILHALC